MSGFLQMTISLYRNVLSTTQNKLTAAIDQIRSSIPHSGETGALIEQQFRSQLEEVLPEQVGVSNGFVVDSIGGVSRQMDIILYNRLNTPRIFTGTGAQMFPVEATYACGEIKASLNAFEFKNSFDKCLSYKKLHRKAYVLQPSPINTTHTLFGSSHNNWQSIFFCIAAESIKIERLIPVYERIVSTKNLAIHERIDTVAALKATSNQNMLLNVSGEIVGGIPSNQSIDLLPTPGSRLCCYEATEPWSLFVMLLLRYMVEAPQELVSMLPYGGTDPY